MGNGATAGIAPRTMLTSSDVKSLLGERYSQMRFDELCSENEDGIFVVSVEQLKHELDQSILSHHYPPNYRPRKMSGSKSETDDRLSSSETIESVRMDKGVGARENRQESHTLSVTKCSQGIHSEHYPPNYHARYSSS